MTVPPEAITAAAEAATRYSATFSGYEWSENGLLRAVIEAAAPLIAAAERERCARLAEETCAYYTWTSHLDARGLVIVENCDLPFADLLRGDQS